MVVYSVFSYLNNVERNGTHRPFGKQVRKMLKRVSVDDSSDEKKNIIKYTLRNIKGYCEINV